MVTQSMRCPTCGKGTLKAKKVHERMFGIDLGAFEAEACDKCGETYFGAEAMDLLESRAKELGIWGLASKVKVARSGNSLVVRIPSKLARYLKLHSGQELLVAPEETTRLVLELT